MGFDAGLSQKASEPTDGVREFDVFYFGIIVFINIVPGVFSVDELPIRRVEITVAYSANLLYNFVQITAGGASITPKFLRLAPGGMVGGQHHHRG